MYDLCPVCFWEDDPDQRARPWSLDGANGISLMEAQQMYIFCGAVDPDFISQVRSPRADEPRDPDWQPYEPTERDLALRAREEAAGSDVEEPMDGRLEPSVRLRAGLDEVRRQASQLTLQEVESRLREVGGSHRFPFGEAEVELFARFFKDEHWVSRHPMQAFAWAWRHRHSASLGLRLRQLRTRTIGFAG